CSSDVGSNTNYIV
nr:immunoglobulin light chain junction region [Macaca mulatta]MPN80635.1 immunoglobulin light chain junction region [Macaca mulatta]MPN80792.1 immunoglobulin light chain junction region [Macaca mulatta]MPN81111.1 immunoglobulin light chain junction region [Macaca mulatta]